MKITVTERIEANSKAMHRIIEIEPSITTERLDLRETAHALHKLLNEAKWRDGAEGDSASDREGSEANGKLRDRIRASRAHESNHETV
jgi:hypothetical protein